MATFAQVKAILDGLVVNYAPAQLKARHGSNSFGWETAATLRCAIAVIAGDNYPLIDPAYVGNNQADQTYLIRILSGPIPEDALPQMPYLGPAYATPDQIDIIRQWINGGAHDDPQPGPSCK